MLNLDTELHSPHSFRIAEEEARLLHFKREHIRYSIKCLGDWSSDTYLIYFTLSNKDKVSAMMKRPAGLQNIL